MRNSTLMFLCLLPILLLQNCASKPSKTVEKSGHNEAFMFVGTYTGQGSQGIYVYKIDSISGNIREISATSIRNPSYLAISKNQKYIFAVTENDTKEESSVSSFSFNPDSGTLTPLSTQPAGGGAPCHLAVSPDEKYLISANYWGGSFTQYEISDKGKLKYKNTEVFRGQGTDPERQTQPHLHFGIFSPDHQYLFLNDLGTDRIYRFQTSSDTQLKAISPAWFPVKNGTGPRHSLFSPDGKFLYVLGEISGRIEVFNYQQGALEQIQSVEADSLHAKGSADIHITPNGKYLYASNRLAGDGIAVFTVNSTSGKLKKTGYQSTGVHPRSFAITSNGKFLVVAARDANKLQVYRIGKNGRLHDTGKSAKVSQPVCIRFWD